MDKHSEPFGGSEDRELLLAAGVKTTKFFPMKLDSPLKDMTLSEKIGIMEELWSDLSQTGTEYEPPDWHDRVLEERRRLAEFGEIGFTDWKSAKKEIRDPTS